MEKDDLTTIVKHKHERLDSLEKEKEEQNGESIIT